MEFPNEGVGNGFGGDVGMSEIVVVMDEGTSFEACNKDIPLRSFGLRIRGINWWIHSIKI